MSRATEQAISDTAQGQNKTFNANAQDAFQEAKGSIDQQQGDVNNYSTQLSKFAADNPYGAGGAYQTSVNQATSNTADAASQAAAQAAQAAAVRGGLNAGAGVAAGQKTAEENTRNLMETQAKANADRITKGAGYNQDVLSASSLPATLQGAITGEQGRLAETEAGAGNTALGVGEKAGEEPGFLDVLGENFAAALGQTAGGAHSGSH